MTTHEPGLTDPALPVPAPAAQPQGEPERILLVPRVVRAGAEPLYLLVRWPDWPHPALLSLDPPSDPSALEAAIADTLTHRLGVRAAGAPVFTGGRQPVRMSQKARGGEGLGWLRAALIDVEGDPAPDVLLEAVLALPLAEALAALTSDVERVLLEAATATPPDAPA